MGDLTDDRSLPACQSFRTSGELCTDWFHRSDCAASCCRSRRTIHPVCSRYRWAHKIAGAVETWQLGDACASGWPDGVCVVLAIRLQASGTNDHARILVLGVVEPLGDRYPCCPAERCFGWRARHARMRTMRQLGRV